MDEKKFKIIAERLEQVGKVVEKLPSEIRIDAFRIFKSYVEDIPKSGKTERAGKVDHADLEETEGVFFNRFDHDKPASNAKLIAANYYREYGTEPFSLEDIREKADSVGITIPSRLNMTFSSAQEKGKKLFQSAGRGKLKPTVSGEAYLKETFSIKKGTKKRSGDDE